MKERAAVQRGLGAAHSELWKAQDRLDGLTVTNSCDDEDATEVRRQRKGLIAGLAAAMSVEDGLAARFKALPEAPF